MLPRLPPAVYNCILPVEQPFTTPSRIYHSPSGQSGEDRQKLYYPAWPEIDIPERQCCLPRLIRAMYSLDLVSIESDEASTDTEEYLSRPEVIAPEIRQQVLSIAKAHYGLPKDSVEIDDLSSLGVYGKKRQLSSGAFNSYMDFLKTAVGSHNTLQLVEAALQGLAYGYMQHFLGVAVGDFSYVFSWLHEMGHYIARFSQSGVLQDGLSKRIHKTLHTLATKSLSPKQIARLWEEFARSIEQSVRFADKFRPIEEIFATYIGLRLLPTEARDKVEASITPWLESKNWNKAYVAFGKACANYRYSPVGLYISVFSVACRVLEQVDIDGAELLCTLAKIREVVSSHIKIITQEHGSNLDVFKLEDMAERDAAEETNQILEQADIPREVYWSAIEMEKTSIYRRLSKSLTNRFSLSNEELEVFCAPVIYLKGKLSSGEITPLIFSFDCPKKDQDTLSPSIRVFCESLCQQLSKPCGIVCPSAYEGKPCCGKKRLLQRLYERLPEEDKSNYEQPNCDLIR